MDPYVFLFFRQIHVVVYDTTVIICNAPSPWRQVSSSYPLLLPCHLLVCCISSCHYVHCIIMFPNLHLSGFPQFLLLSVLSPATLARARGMSEILFYKWPENVLGMG